MKDPSSGAFQKVPIWARKPSSLGLAFVVMIPTGALETIQKALHDKRKFNVDESATKVKYCFSLGDKFPELESNLSMIAANDRAVPGTARNLSLSPEAHFCKALLGLTPLPASPSLFEQSHLLSSVPALALGEAMKVARILCRDRGGGGGGFANLTADDWTVVGRALVNATTGNERDAFSSKRTKSTSVQGSVSSSLLSSRPQSTAPQVLDDLMGQSEFDDPEGLPFVGGVTTGIELEIFQCPVEVDPPLLSGEPPAGFNTFARILVNSAAAIEIKGQVGSRLFKVFVPKYGGKGMSAENSGPCSAEVEVLEGDSIRVTCGCEMNRLANMASSATVHGMEGKACWHTSILSQERVLTSLLSKELLESVTTGGTAVLVQPFSAKGRNYFFVESTARSGVPGNRRASMVSRSRTRLHCDACHTRAVYVQNGGSCAHIELLYHLPDIPGDPVGVIMKDWIGRLPPQEELHGPSGFNKVTQLYEYPSLTRRLAEREQKQFGTLLPIIDLNTSPRTPSLGSSKDSRVRRALILAACQDGSELLSVLLSSELVERLCPACYGDGVCCETPPGDATSSTCSMCFQCSNCAAPSGHDGASLQTCAGCNVARYCGADCQTEYQKKGHSCYEGQLHGPSSNYLVSMTCSSGCLGTYCFNCAFRMQLLSLPSNGLFFELFPELRLNLNGKGEIYSCFDLHVELTPLARKRRAASEVPEGAQYVLQPNLPVENCLCGSPYSSRGYRNVCTSEVYSVTHSTPAVIQELNCPMGEKECVRHFIGPESGMIRQTSGVIFKVEVFSLFFHKLMSTSGEGASSFVSMMGMLYLFAGSTRKFPDHKTFLAAFYSVLAMTPENSTLDSGCPTFPFAKAEEP
jgi:hypothetical protein